jgi:hypothetical protein
MPAENQAVPLGTGNLSGTPSASQEAARKKELENLRAELIEAQRKVLFLRERIRSLGGIDLASEAGLP